MTTEQIENKRLENITNAHQVPFLKILKKGDRIICYVLTFFSILFLGLMLYIPSILIYMAIALIFCVCTMGFLWYKNAKEKLLKVFYLTKVNDEVYHWVEVWDLKSRWENYDGRFLWLSGKQLTPIIDIRNPAEPQPFTPFGEDKPLGTVSSGDIAHCIDQSPTLRLFSVSKGQLLEAFKYGILLLCIGGFAVGLFALLDSGNSAP